MKKIWLIFRFIFLFALLAFLFWFLSSTRSSFFSSLIPKKNPCATPQTYTLGFIDPRFGLSRADFQTAIEEAGAIWATAVQKELFRSDPHGALTINLVYDTRQEITQTGSVLKSTITVLKEKHQIAREEYITQLREFNNIQEVYKKEVMYWNNLGGAPSEAYDALQKQKNNLLTQRDLLGERKNQLDQSVANINNFIQTYNTNNERIGSEFEEGLYISDQNGTRIDIYQFENKTALLRVLTHELGHALGLEHNTNPNSFMNYLNQSDNMTPTEEDLRDLKKQCS